MRKIYIFLSLLISITTIAQETITVMQYNLTYYGSTDADPGFDCNTSTNNVASKDGYLSTILNEVNPDVFCANEIMIKTTGDNNYNSNRILSNVLGSDYEKAEATGYFIGNMLFYKKDKLGLVKQSNIDKDLSGAWLVREIDFYTLYYKDADLATHQDTIYMTFVVAHLKAGESSDAERSLATAAAMDYIENNDLGKNIFFMGDLNVYSDQDQAYQNLTNYTNSSVNFFDPVNQEGEWHNGSAYRLYHTQSTRSSSNDNGGCFVSGGLDDRFDFVLINNDIRDNISGVHYKSGSYKAFGQDASATNNGTPLNTTNNSVVSTTVAQALFDMSDHLPIVMELDITQGPLAINEQDVVSSLEFNNPISNELNINLALRQNIRDLSINIYDITGKRIMSNPVTVKNDRIYQSINTALLPQGIYILNIVDTNNQTSLVTEKLIKY